MKFGEKLYDLRKKNGYTKVELAKMLGVTTRTIAGYEKEDRYPKKREIYQKLSEIFQVPLNYLYTENTSSDEFIAKAGEVFGKRGRMEAQQLALDLSELFASGELSDERKEPTPKAARPNDLSAAHCNRFLERSFVWIHF